MASIKIISITSIMATMLLCCGSGEEANKGHHKTVRIRHNDLASLAPIRGTREWLIHGACDTLCVINEPIQVNMVQRYCDQQKMMKTVKSKCFDFRMTVEITDDYKSDTAYITAHGKYVLIDDVCYAMDYQFLRLLLNLCPLPRTPSR